MRSVARLLLIWLLAVALPVHALATSTMLLCAKGHHGLSRPAGGDVHASRGHDHASHGHARGLDAQGGSPATKVSANADHAAQTMHGSADSRHGDHVAGKCNACASCCAAAYLPPVPIVIDGAAPRQAPDAFEPASHVGFITDGPERPPRSRRA